MASVSGFSFLAETIETLPTHPKPGVSKQKPAKPFLFITLQGRKHTHTHKNGFSLQEPKTK
jgi:hypothetical protein